MLWTTGPCWFCPENAITLDKAHSSAKKKKKSIIFIFPGKHMLWYYYSLGAPLPYVSNEYPHDPAHNKTNNKTCTTSEKKKVREKSRKCYNHKPQPFPDTKRKRKPTNPNKHKSNKRTKSTKISSLFPKRGNRNAKRTEKHKNKMTQG